MIRLALWFLWRHVLEPLSFAGLRVMLFLVVAAVAGRACR